MTITPQLIRVCCMLVSVLAAGYACGMTTAVFLQDGKVVTGPGTSPAKASGVNEIVPAQPVSAIWGTTADGRIVATLKESHEEHEDHLEGHSHEAAGPAALLSPLDGRTTVIETKPILRIFPSPSGDALLFIDTDRNAWVWRDGASSVTISAPGCVSHGSWSPDGKTLALAVYPPDWSQAKVDSPGNVENFLRLQNSDIYLADAVTGQIQLRVTDDTGTDYNPFFSPDGGQLYYVWLHQREDEGGLRSIRLPVPGTARDVTKALLATDGSSTATRITRAGEDPGEIPLGRVGTYTFTPDGSTLVFEAGKPDGTGVIWSMSLSGDKAAALAEGRKPQWLPDGSLAFMNNLKSVQILTSEAVRK